MTRLDKPVRYPEDIKTFLSIRGVGQQDFEGLLCGQRVWGLWPILISSPRPRPRRVKRPRMNEEDPKLLGGIAEDRPVLSELVSWKEKAAHHPKQPSQSSQTKGPTRGDSYGGMVEEQL